MVTLGDCEARSWGEARRGGARSHRALHPSLSGYQASTENAQTSGEFRISGTFSRVFSLLNFALSSTLHPKFGAKNSPFFNPIVLKDGVYSSPPLFKQALDSTLPLSTVLMPCEFLRLPLGAICFENVPVWCHKFSHKFGYKSIWVLLSNRVTSETPVGYISIQFYAYKVPFIKIIKFHNIFKLKICSSFCLDTSSNLFIYLFMWLQICPWKTKWKFCKWKPLNAKKLSREEECNIIFY